MATNIEVPLSVKVLQQDAELDKDSKPTGKWRVVAAIASKAHADDTYFTVPLTALRRVILSATKGAIVPVRNTSRLHTLRIRQRVKKGRKWEQGGTDRFVAPNTIGDVFLDEDNNVIVEEMPS